MVVLVPVPFVVVPPGVLVTVHVPDDGNPLKTTLPVSPAPVGVSIVPTVGADGVEGLALITTLAEAVEVPPSALVTVKVYVPAASPEMVVLVPVPVVVIPPGVLVNVQIPDEGKPPKTTLPVATAHVGWIIVPTMGAVIWDTAKTASSESESGFVSSSSVAVKVIVSMPYQLEPGMDMVAIRLTIETPS